MSAPNQVQNNSIPGSFYSDQYVSKDITFRGWVDEVAGDPRFTVSCRFHKVGQRVDVEFRFSTANTSPGSAGITSYRSEVAPGNDILNKIPSQFRPNGTASGFADGRCDSVTLFSGTALSIYPIFFKSDGDIRISTTGVTPMPGAMIPLTGVFSYYITA